VKPGEKLALARRYQAPALTQKDLAKKLGVDTSSVGRWESTDEIPPARLPAVSRILRVPVQWFFDGRDDPPPGLAFVAQGNAAEVPQDRVGGADARSLVQGDEVLLPTWRGVMASDGECEFYETGAPELNGVPSFLAGNDPDNHILCIASGASMYPRVKNGERVVVRLERNPPNNAIVIARRPDGANFVKVLRQNDRGFLELHSLNPEFQPIVKLDNWEMRGYAVAVLHSYEMGQANIEWDSGRVLKA
jgi:transcriptional regulator with XRE-family HTH domain